MFIPENLVLENFPYKRSIRICIPYLSTHIWKIVVVSILKPQISSFWWFRYLNIIIDYFWMKSLSFHSGPQMYLLQESLSISQICLKFHMHDFDKMFKDHTMHYFNEFFESNKGCDVVLAPAEVSKFSVLLWCVSP